MPRTDAHQRRGDGRRRTDHSHDRAVGAARNPIQRAGRVRRRRLHHSSVFHSETPSRRARRFCSRNPNLIMRLSNRNVGRLFRMELPELMFRGKQETFKIVDRIRATRAKPVSRIEANRERLSRFLQNAQKRFFEGVFDSRVSEVLQSANADDCQAVLVTAHHASRGRFDLLGYRGLEFGDPVDWHFDPVSGRRAPLAHWSRVDPLDCTTTGDSKVIWELNRHQWLVHLGQAWRLTGDQRYAQDVVHYMQAWLRLNPT